MSHAPIFIVGCPRSGTGLLRNLLRSHPRLTFPGETHFLPCFYQAYGNPTDDPQACRLAKKILGLQWVKEWELALEPSALASCRTFSELVARIYQAWARKENKPRWGDKTPQYVMDIPVLLELFPDARIIHMIRDGRDVALSWLGVNFGPRNVYTAALAWKRFVLAGRAHGETLPIQTYRELYYERLVAQPRETLQSICAFLDESFHDDMLKPSGLETKFRDPIFGSRRPRYVSQTEVVSGNTAKWKTGLTSRDLALFESVAGDLLSKLGYESVGRSRKISAAERACWRAHDTMGRLVDRINSGEKARWFKTDLMLRWAAFRSRTRRPARGRAIRSR